MPRARGVELPREHVVGEAELEDLVDARRERRCLHGHDHLDAALEIARHQVGGADVVARITAAAEPVDARVLEERPHDRADPDRLGQTRNARPQTAHAAHDQVDLDALSRCLVERVDQLAVGEAVDLDRDPPDPRELPLALDLLEQPAAQRARCDQQLAVGGLLAAAGEIVEQLRGVGGECVGAAEQTEVLVGARRLRVIVAGADVHVAADAVGLRAHHERDLAVRLEADHAVHDVHARLLEHLRELDVGLFVEARGKLDKRHHLLAGGGGLDQVAHQRVLDARRAVERVLDREHRGVVGGLGEERLGGIAERLVRVLHEHVLLADRREQVRGAVRSRSERGRRHGHVGRQLGIGPVERVDLPQ